VADTCHYDLVLHPRNIIELASHPNGRRIVSNIFYAKIYLALFVPQHQIGFGPEDEAATALPHNPSGYRSVSQEFCGA
jgi:hypothetical protein